MTPCSSPGYTPQHALLCRHFRPLQGFVAVKGAVKQWVDLLNARFDSLKPVAVQDFHPDEVDDDIIKG